MGLRPYQQKAFDYAINYLKNGGRRLCLVAPTGAGKTVLFSSIFQHYQNKFSMFLLVHKNDLIWQASNHLSKNGVQHSIIGNDKVIKSCRQKNPNYCWGQYVAYPNVAICSVQTLINKMERIPTPKVIICDELHHYCSPQFKKILSYYNQSRIIGLTATPERLDGKGLGSIVDDLYEIISVKELIDMGFLCKYKIFAPQSVDMKGVGKSMGDFNLKQAKDKLDKTIIYGDVIKEYQKHCDHKPAIAFCINIEHSKQVAEEFIKAGYKAKALTSDIKDPAERNKYIEMLGNGELDILTSCEMISEGTDVPIVSCVLLLRPTMSFTLYRQQVGRGLRPAQDKEYLIILDFVGNTMRHGFPDDEVEWSLKDKEKKKSNTENLGLTTCPNCYAIYPVHKTMCPYCGFEKPKLEREIEQDKNVVLWEFDPEKERARVEQELLLKHPSELKSATEFFQYAKAKGYKRGWAYRQCQMKGLLK